MRNTGEQVVMKDMIYETYGRRYDSQRVKDNQITGFKYTKMYITDRGKTIPIEIWEEVKPKDSIPNTVYLSSYNHHIRNSGGRTYLVTKSNYMKKIAKPIVDTGIFTKEQLEKAGLL